MGTAAAGSRRGGRASHMAPKLAKNVAASRPNAAGNPALAITSPPTIGPPINAIWRDVPRTAFPVCKISGGTSSGMIAFSAGSKNEWVAPKTNAST